MSKRRPRSNRTEHKMVEMLDELAEFESFKDDVLPLLRKAIKEGWTEEQIANHPRVQAMLTARRITIALRDPDSSKALAAINSHQDRTKGKPTERREVKHELAQVPDEQLDSILMSKLQEVTDDDDVQH